jgi:hypothetical protein
MIQKVNFRVDPKGLTRLIREMWAEGSYDKCLNILAAVKHGEPLSLEVQYDIIRGNKKLALYRNDPDSFCIKPDKWKPKTFLYYPDPSPDKLAAFLKIKSEQEAERQVSRALRGYSPTNEDESEQVVGSLLEQRTMKKFAGYDSLEEMNMAYAFKRSIPTPEQMIETLNSRDERAEKGKPTPDPTLLADAAWVSPLGDFYPCQTPMEHVWLVGQFGFSEVQAENRGWIKITRDFVGKRLIHRGKKEATQKQIDTLFDWCEKHNHDFPEWARGLSA